MTYGRDDRPALSDGGKYVRYLAKFAPPDR